MNPATDGLATIDLPRSLDEVTAAWLSRALSVRFPGTVVARADEGDTIRGMATKIQLHLTYADGGNPADLPASMWLKTGFEKHSARSAELYAAEVNFFRVVAPAVPTNAPRHAAQTRIQPRRTKPNFQLFNTIDKTTERAKDMEVRGFRPLPGALPSSNADYAYSQRRRDPDRPNAARPGVLAVSDRHHLVGDKLSPRGGEPPEAPRNTWPHPD